MIAALLAGILTFNCGLSVRTEEHFKLQIAGDGTELLTAGEGTRLWTAGDGIRLQIAGEGTRLRTAGDGIRLQIAGEGTALRTAGEGSASFYIRFQTAGEGTHLRFAGDGSQFQTAGEGSTSLSDKTTQRLITGCRRGQSLVQLQLLSVEEDRTDGSFKLTMLSTKSSGETCYFLVSLSVASSAPPSLIGVKATSTWPGRPPGLCTCTSERAATNNTFTAAPPRGAHRLSRGTYPMLPAHMMLILDNDTAWHRPVQLIPGGRCLKCQRQEASYVMSGSTSELQTPWDAAVAATVTHEPLFGNDSREAVALWENLGCGLRSESVVTKVMWWPIPATVETTAMGAFARAVSLERGYSYEDLCTYSTEEPDDSWSALMSFLKIEYEGSLDSPREGDTVPIVQWFPSVRLSFAENLLLNGLLSSVPLANAEAIVSVSEAWPGERRVWTFVKVHEAAARAAAALARLRVDADDCCAVIPNVRETIIAMLTVMNVDAMYTSCSADFGVEAIVNRFCQKSPKVLFVANGYVEEGKHISTVARVEELAGKLGSCLKCIMLLPMLKMSDCAQCVFHDEHIPSKVASWDEFPTTIPANNERVHIRQLRAPPVCPILFGHDWAARVHRARLWQPSAPARQRTSPPQRFARARKQRRSYEPKRAPLCAQSCLSGLRTWRSNASGHGRRSPCAASRLRISTSRLRWGN